MIEITGNFWDEAQRFDAACITTNGFVKKDGACVMGAGIAKQARDRYDGIDENLGWLINQYGNDVWVLFGPGHHTGAPGLRIWNNAYTLLSFPVKHHWREQADPRLIRKSARELLVLAQAMGWERILSVRPGCGNGGLQWSDVRAILDPLWDDRFYIIERKDNG